MKSAAFLLLAGLAAAPALASEPTIAQPPALPDGVRAMIEAAMRSGDAKAVETVTALAKMTHPSAAGEIDMLSQAFNNRRAEEARLAERKRIEELTRASFIEKWKGQVELGASRSTGNTDSLGLYGSLSAEREGLKWRHRFTARADIQESNNITTTERVLVAWQPNYKFDDRAYAFGLGQYEYDPVLGYDSRLTLGGGIGYGVIRTPAMKLDFEGGPALRRTDWIADQTNTTLSARGSLNFGWKISPTVELNQAAAFYYEPGDSSATALTSLDTKLIGDLKARFSYNVQYEASRPPGVEPVDTLSRATLIYNF